MRKSLVVLPALLAVLALAYVDGRNQPSRDAAVRVAQSKDKAGVGTKNCAEGKRWDTRSRMCV